MAAKTNKPASPVAAHQKTAGKRKKVTGTSRVPGDTGHKKLVHELQVHQVELELQNTELARTRNEAELLKEKYLDLYDFAPVGYFTLDGKGTILELNLTGAAFLSLPRKDIPGHNFIAFLTPQSFPLFNEFLRATRETGERHICELELAVARESPPAFVRIEGTAWLNKSRFLDRIQIAVSDITAQKTMEAQLIESEEWFRRLFESAQDAILIIDGDSGKITHANRSILDLLGYPLDFFIGSSLGELEILRDRDLAKDIYAELRLNRYIRYEVDLALTTCRGEAVRSEVIGNVYLVGDKRIIQFNLRDITAREDAQDSLLASETRYRRLFESAQDGILIIDEESEEIIDANPFIVALLGYPLDYFVGKHLWDLGFIRDRERAKAGFAELKTKGYFRYGDLPFMTKDGRAIDVEFISNVYPVNLQKIIQCNIRDITDRKRAENVLREVQGYLENLVG